MSTQGVPWVRTAVVAGVLHLVLLAPLAGGESFILDNVFRPDGEGISSGLAPYGRAVDFEYPPLAVPLIAGPAEVTSSADGYREVFGWSMIAFDLLIVALLAFGLRRDRSRQLGGLAVYSLGLVPLALQNLATARFDLAPAALLLAALFARESERSALWGALCGLGGAVKAFPLALAPVLARGDRSLRRSVVGLTLPLGLAAVLAVALGGTFGSAIGYHTGRDLQIESLGSSLLILAHQFGADARVVFGSGSFNLVAPGDGVIRALSGAVVLTGLAAVVTLAWQRAVAPALLATAAIAVLVVPAPVLSPQFLIWVLPLSAAAFGWGRENALLLGACALTWLTIEIGFPVQQRLGAEFVWPLLARNAVLLAYLVLVLRRLQGDGPRDTPLTRRRITPSSSSATSV